MKAGRRIVALLLVGVAVAAGPVEAQPPPPTGTHAAPGQLGLVRVRIDPGVGEQESAIRQLLAAHSFVRIAEPADYLVTTDPDFPLDLSLRDLREPPILWQQQIPEDVSSAEEPTRFAVGNLVEPTTPARLTETLTAAARVRALLDRSFADMQGIEACVVIDEPPPAGTAASAPQCVPIDRLGTRRIVFGEWVSTIRVTNRSTGDRYIAVAAAETNLKAGPSPFNEGTLVQKIAPGQTIDLNPNFVRYHYPRDPRVMLMVSARRFAVDNLLQPAPLDPDGACADRSTAECRPNLSPLAVNDDLAVRSIQLNIPPEPMPAMGNGSDVTARMAVWMAQFYSVIPHTLQEIAADAKLPDAQRQFLRERTYQERQHRCGAALIAPNLVITAAHCVAKDKYAGDGIRRMMTERRIRLGSRRIGLGGQTYAITGVAVHPGYDADAKTHDVALLLLGADRGSTGTLPPPVAVADRPLAGGTKALAFGWGLTGAVDPDGNIMLTLGTGLRQRNAEVLQYGEMQSVSLAECRRKLAKVQPGMVCMYSAATLAGRESRDGVFTCRGDSGGPLVRKVGQRDVLVGLVSWSVGCGFKQFPSVFTDAGSYAAWIAAAKAELKPGAAIRPRDPARPAFGASRH